MRVTSRTHFYPRSPCGERHFSGSAWVQEFPISIHALLAESDRFCPICQWRRSVFLSTLSLRRATRKLPMREPTALHFYPRSPCGERPLLSIRNTRNSAISIHALLAESDAYHFMPKIGTLHFYPRSPCGERLLHSRNGHNVNRISIHALLAESDTSEVSERVPLAISIHALLAESDPMDVPQYQILDISIHALLAESDPPAPPKARVLKNFYPRSPCGERRIKPIFGEINANFYPRSPCGERQVTF